MNGQLLAGLMPLLMLAPFFIFLFARPRRDCPDCGKRLSPVQSPFTKTRRQWVEGGYLCSNCGCETDLAGKKVATGSGPRPGWLLGSVLLVAPPVLGAIVLLFLIMNHGRPAPAAPPAPAPPRFIAAPTLVAPAAVEPGR
jgi:hypothetical protein